MIHVCFGLYDKNGTYSKFTGTTILSLFENTTSGVTVHILHDNTLTPDNRDKFIQLANRYKQAVKFYNVEELCKNELAKFLQIMPFMRTARTSIGTFYKFLIQYALDKNIAKVIYLDADIIVNLDINELWQVELGDRPLGAVTVFSQYKNSTDGFKRMECGFDLPELGLVKAEDYFNAGVLVMNLKYLRNEEEKILAGMKFRSDHPEFYMFDQCIWNYCFSTQALKLPAKFNREVILVRTRDGGIVEKKIYHFTSNNSFWSFGMNTKDTLNMLLIKYFVKTPWFNEDIIGRLYESLLTTFTELKKYTMNLSAAMAGKTRVFITVEKEWASLVKNFSVKNDEEVIFIKPNITVQNLIDMMNASRHEKMFFFMLPYFPLEIFEKAGFVQDKDFIDCSKFLSADFNSYPFIAAM